MSMHIPSTTSSLKPSKWAHFEDAIECMTNLVLLFQNVWPIPDGILLWLHGTIQRRPGHHLRHRRLCGHESLRA